MDENSDNQHSSAASAGESDSIVTLPPDTVEDNLREIGELLNIAGANYERILKITKKVDANMMLLMKTQEVNMALQKTCFNGNERDESQGNGKAESLESGENESQ